MSLSRRHNERENLLHLIKEWNESRLDIFALSQPNEKLEFYGVMRFFFQDAGAKVATKCVRVNSDQTAEDVTKTLVDKFHPDMKMLTMPKYSLYEVHQNSDARKLEKGERPLMVQLKWHEDDREGRFLLKSESNKNVVPTNLFASSDLAPIANPNFKRKLSKREKKEMKKKRQEEKKTGKKEPEPAKEPAKVNESEAIAQQLYDEIPESGFTRSISNPEAVLRRRRQQKLEKKLKEFEGKDGSPDTGGPLRIYAETLKPEIPYKTLLVSMHAQTTLVVKDALEKYGMEKEDPEEYCLVMVNFPSEGQSRDSTMGKDIVIHDEDCPFAVVSTWPDDRGELTLHLRRRTNLPKYRQKKTPRGSSSSASPQPGGLQASIDKDKLPYLIQLTPDGRELEYRPKMYYIQPNVTEVGSENSSGSTSHFFPLFAPHILPQHSVIASNDGVVTVTPCSSDAETAVNGARIFETTKLHHQMIVRFGRVHAFRFVDPVKEKELEEERRLRAEETHSVSSGTSSTGEGTKATPVQYVRQDPIASMNRRSAASAARSTNTSFLKDQQQRADPAAQYRPDPAAHQRPDPAAHRRPDHEAEIERKRFSETTFGVGGEIETVASPTKKDPPRDQRFFGTHERPQQGRDPGRPPPGGDHQRRSIPPVVVAEPMDDDDDDDDEGMDLPARLEYREAGEDAFFAAVISEVNGAAVHFKLAPTYTVYMCSRYRISPVYRPEISREQRAKAFGVTARRIANMVRSTVRENNESASSLSFWMANASELLYFMKQDRDLSPHSVDAQQILGQSVHHAFKLLVHCIQQELAKYMPSFLDESDESDHDESDLESVLSGEGSRRRTGKPVVGDILYTLSTAMSLLYRCRVNAALTIQIFSQLYHFINMWLFNKIVLHPELELCTQAWGGRLKRRLSIIEAWAAKQGMELAADCHLCRINQAAHLLQAPKGCAEDITSISSTCFKLNSLQLRCLLEYYIPSEDEPGIPPELIDNVVAIAENTADELTRSDGQDVQLEEDPDLQLPFLLPEDGYSSDLIRGIPPGLREFLNPLCATGLCRLTVQPMSPGLWTVHFKDFRFSEAEGADKARKVSEGGTVYGLREPEINFVTLNKGNGGMGLSIVAAKGAGQEHLGIYVKAVVKGGCADRDGRLAPGDQLISVNGDSLVGVSQERAAELMKKTGATVQLQVAKQGAIYHGLATLLNQSTPAKDPSQRLKPVDQGHPHPVSPTLPEGEMQPQQLRWLNEEERSPKPKSQPNTREQPQRDSRSDEDDHWAEMERRREQERKREMERKKAEEERRQIEEEQRREDEERRQIEEERQWREEKQREEEQRRAEHERQVKLREEEQRRVEYERQVKQREEQRRQEYEKLVEEQRRETEDRRRSQGFENERNAPRIVVDEHREKVRVTSVSEEPSYTIRAHEEPVIRAQEGSVRSPQDNDRNRSVRFQDEQETSDEDNERSEAMVEERIVEQSSRILRSERPPSPHSPSSPSYTIRFDDGIPTPQQTSGSLSRQSQEPKRERPPSRGKPTYGRVIAVTRESMQLQRSPVRDGERDEIERRKAEEEHRSRIEHEQEIERQKQREKEEQMEKEYKELVEKQRIEEEERKQKERQEQLENERLRHEEEEQRRKREEDRLERVRRQQEEELLERERREREEENRERERRQQEVRLERERRQREEEEIHERELRRREEEEHLERERRQREEELRERERKQQEEERLERQRKEQEEDERRERQRKEQEEDERHERERRQREEEELRERERKEKEEQERIEREYKLQEEEDRRRREQDRLNYERQEWERRQREEERLAYELKQHEEKRRLQHEEKMRKQREEEERIEKERLRKEQEEQERKEQEEKERQKQEAEERRVQEEKRLEFERREHERKEREQREREDKEMEERQRLMAEERLRNEEDREEAEKRMRKERLQQLYQEQHEKEEDDRREFELRKQKDQDRKEKEQHEHDAEEQERIEEERIMKQLEEDEIRERREKEIKRREQEDEIRQREEEQRWMREVEQQRAFLREPQQGIMHNSGSLDRIDQMNPDDVEKEFNRRLEEEKQRSQRRSRVHDEDDEELQRQGQEEKIAREQRRLERLHLEREQQRQVQQRIQEQRQREQEEWLAQQKLKREQQRLEQEQQRTKYKMKEEEERERKRSEMLHKRELEDRIRRESVRQRDLEEHKIREERRQVEMKKEHEKLSKLEEQRIIQEKDDELRRYSRDSGHVRVSNDLHPVHQHLVQQALGYQERRRMPSDDYFRYDGQRRDPRAGNDQQLRQARSTPHLLNNEDSDFSMHSMRKHVSFSDVTTEIPHSPTTPLYTQAPMHFERPYFREDDPPPPPPPPPAEEVDEDDFPAPPLPPPPQKLPPPPPPKSHNTYVKYEQQMQRRPPPPRDDYSHGNPHEGFHGNSQDGFPSTTVITRRQFVSDSDYTNYRGEPQRRSRPLSYPSRPTEGSGHAVNFSYSNEELYRQDQPAYVSANLRPVPPSPVRKDFDDNDTNQGGLRRLLTDTHKNQGGPPPIAPKPEKMSFREKLKVFNPNEYTPPPSKVRASKWQQQQLSQLNGQ